MDSASLNARLEKALDPDYWERLAPTASVCRRSAKVSSTAVQEHDTTSAFEALKEEGWFRLEGFFPQQQVARMAECVRLLDHAGWLPTYCFVFDEFWDLMRGAAIQQLLAKLIGPDYMQKTAAWIHFVKTTESSHGWPPHVDGQPAEGPILNADGSTRLLSIWIALSDATLDNGCIYLLPADRIPPSSYATRSATELLQSVQAVPLNAGAIAGWRQDLLHWGSFTSRRAAGPRISIAVEFQSATKNGNPTHSLIDGQYIPSTLQERLYFISQQVLMYTDRFGAEQDAEKHLATAAALGTSLQKSGRDGPRADPEPVVNE